MKNTGTDVGDLRKLVAVADLLIKDPTLSGNELVRKTGGGSSSADWNRFTKWMKGWQKKPFFKQELRLQGKMLWDDVKPFEEVKAKRSFPDARIERGGLTLYGQNVAAAVRLFLNLLDIAMYSNRPLNEVIPSLGAAETDVRRFHDDLFSSEPVDEEEYDRQTEQFKQPKPWDYHQIKNGFGLRFKKIDPIPEAWKECIEIQWASDQTPAHIDEVDDMKASPSDGTQPEEGEKLSGLSGMFV